MIHCTVVQLASFARRGPSFTAIAHNMRLDRVSASKRHDFCLAIHSAKKVARGNVFFGFSRWNCSWSDKSVWQEMQNAFSVLTPFNEATDADVEVEPFELLLGGFVFGFPFFDFLHKIFVVHGHRAFANASGVRFYGSTKPQRFRLSLSGLALQATNIVKDCLNDFLVNADDMATVLGHCHVFFHLA